MISKKQGAGGRDLESETLKGGTLAFQMAQVKRVGLPVYYKDHSHTTECVRKGGSGREQVKREEGVGPSAGEQRKECTQRLPRARRAVAPLLCSPRRPKGKAALTGTPLN